MLQQLEETSAQPRRRAGMHTLGQVRDALASGEDANSQRIRLLTSAINTVAKASRCSPEDIPAHPGELRVYLRELSPAMVGLSKSSWSSVRSRVLRALRLTHVTVFPSRRGQPLVPAWAGLYEALPDNSCKRGLSRFISYLSLSGIGPEEVDDAIVGRYFEELQETSVRVLPRGQVRAAVRGWNTAVTTIADWPQRELSDIPVDRKAYVLPTTSFPLSFQQSLFDYIDFLTHPPEEDDDAPLHPLKRQTLQLREFQFRQMASVLVHRGVPATELNDIGDLARREHIGRMAEFFAERHAGRRSSSLIVLLNALRPMVRNWLKDLDLARWISRYRARMFGRHAPVGMTEKNRRRLSLFQDPRLVRDLLLLPYKLLKRAEAGGLPPHRAAVLVRTAVAIEIELMCPIRLGNLATIDTDRDFIRTRNGRGTTTNLFIDGSRTKNGEEIELEIPPQTVALIDLYLSKYRNQLILPDCRGRTPRYLFPGQEGGAVAQRYLGNTVGDALERELGIQFNIHLFRHLGCYLYLRSHPGQMDVMRRVLGHRSVTTTERFYAFIEQSDAFRMFDQHVLRMREDFLRPGRKPPKNRGAKR